MVSYKGRYKPTSISGKCTRAGLIDVLCGRRTVDLWLRGTANQLLPYLLDEQGNAIDKELLPGNADEALLAGGGCRMSTRHALC